jgi:hypothetical protein
MRAATKQEMPLVRLAEVAEMIYDAEVGKGGVEEAAAAPAETVDTL